MELCTSLDTLQIASGRYVNAIGTVLANTTFV